MIMIEELYDALRAANVPDDKARAAAREVAKHDTDIQALTAEMKAMRAEFTSRFNLLQWLIGYVAAVLTALVVKGFIA
jgi:hypothetical protein